jgi:hypothetical protein
MDRRPRLRGCAPQTSFWAHTSKAIEIEDVEARVAALERAAEASKQDRLQ